MNYSRDCAISRSVSSRPSATLIRFASGGMPSFQISPIWKRFESPHRILDPVSRHGMRLIGSERSLETHDFHALSLLVPAQNCSTNPDESETDESIDANNKRKVENVPQLTGSGGRHRLQHGETYAIHRFGKSQRRVHGA